MICLECKIEFIKRANSQKYCSSTCFNSAYYKKNRVKITAYHKKYIATHPITKEKRKITSNRSYHKRSTELINENPALLMWRRVKNRAKKDNLIFSIAPSDIVIPETCPILGLPLVFQRGERRDNSPSLDRIDSSRGYEKGNIQVLSWRANRLKSDATLEDLEKLYKYALSLVK